MINHISVVDDEHHYTQTLLERKHNTLSHTTSINRWPRPRALAQRMLVVFILTQALLVTAIPSTSSETTTTTTQIQATQTPESERQSSTTTITELPSSTTTTLQIDPSILSQLPQPFDTSIGNNFTSPSCPTFFNTFLNDQAFQHCSPFSLLLQTSASFFSMSKSAVQISRAMDTACKVDFASCSSLMSTLATQVRQNANCGQDLQLRNPLVVQAYNGFLAYDSLYQAGCLKDYLGNYCYGNAMLNTTDSSTYYVYYLPLGVQLPGTAQPSCTECLRDTMTIFAASASNSSKPVSKDYLAAAQTINSHCGATFAQANIVSSSAIVPISWSGRSSWCWYIMVTFFALFW